MNSRYTGRRKTSPYDPALSTALVPNRRNLTRLLSVLSLLVTAVLFVLWVKGGSSIKDRTSLDVGKINGRVIARDWESHFYEGGEGKKDKGKRQTGGQEMPVRGKGWTIMANQLKGNAQQDEVVLILTPMKNSIEHIWHFFSLVDSLTYPRHLIQIGILVSDSSDRTYERALELADERQYTHGTKGLKARGKYGKISVFRKDFAHTEAESMMKALDEQAAAADSSDPTPVDGLSNIGKSRHSYALQLPRRRLLARSRSFLLTSALTPEVDYTLWMDVDVVEYEKDLIQTLLGWARRERAEVVVPNCMWKSYNEMGGYDLNNWSETIESLEHKSKLPADEIMIEGYASHPTYRRSLVSLYPPTASTPEAVLLDGVGGCTTLVLASLHRQGAIFPTWPIDHQIETEGFAQIVKKLGGRMIGLTNVFVFHGLYG